MTHRLTLSLIGAAALAIILTVPLTSAHAEPPDAADHADHQEGQQSEHESGSTENEKASESQDHGAAEKKAIEASTNTSCGTLETAAARYGLSAGFFRRLIQQESNFDPKAVSRAGAMGIAQFMPGTARWRGLSDPFEPGQALNESARWLSELRALFGNLGLAAAAYNAGPQRVRDWIAGRGKLPDETRAYVRIVTGLTADEWLHDDQAKAHDFDEPAGPCAAIARAPSITPSIKTEARREPAADKPPPGWGLQLIGNTSAIRALAEYAQLQIRFRSVLGDRTPTVIRVPLGGRMTSHWFFVKVAESSRERATQLCLKLRSAGGSCLVTPN
jgi:hypothetical protein